MIVSSGSRALPASGGLYSGGSAQMVENSLNIHGDEILYVGDHIYTDVSQSKVHLRWRTALICRELEEEVSIVNTGSVNILLLTDREHRKDTKTAQVFFRFNLENSQTSLVNEFNLLRSILLCKYGHLYLLTKKKEKIRNLSGFLA